MKFSHSLQFNAVPEWSSKYLSYSSLKKVIYTLQKESLQINDEEQALLSNKDAVSTFQAALDRELKKIDGFFVAKSQELSAEFDTLLQSIEDYHSELMLKSDIIMNMEGSWNQYSDQPMILAPGMAGVADDGAADDAKRRGSQNSSANSSLQNSPINSAANSPTVSPVASPVLTATAAAAVGLSGSFARTFTLRDSLLQLSDLKITLKKRVVLLYTQIAELQSFVDLNRTGFKKILKKFDKTLPAQLSGPYLDSMVHKSTVFTKQSAKSLDQWLAKLTDAYADISGSTHAVAEKELKVLLREHVVWERNTVWREMIQVERKAAGAVADGDSGAKGGAGTQGQVPWSFVEQIKNSKSFFAAFAVMAFLMVFSPFSDVRQGNCFVILVGSSILWATEAIPLFVTALFVPLLAVVLKVLRYDDKRIDNYGETMTSQDASKYILASMWSSVIMLLLGGFTVAAALSKYSITKIFSAKVLAQSGTNPRAVLFAIMALSLCVSAVVSNVAAPVLCYSISQPVLRTLPQGSPFGKALVLGVAFASNLGGMSSPISSPQNIIAIDLMEPHPSWLSWFAVSVPVCFVCLVAIWILLCVTFQVSEDRVKLPHLSSLSPASKDPFTSAQIFVMCVSGLTIGLWCFANTLAPIFGDIGLVSLIPIVIFFGSGILTSEDWNNFMWTIVALAMGGSALGKAVASSGLLKTIADAIEEHVLRGLSVYQVCLIFGFLCLIISTFISHTVSALILLPLIKEIGKSMDQDHSRLLVMLNVLLCSVAMGLPTSGFPNVTAICMTDELGMNYVNVKTFITRGVPSSLLAYVVIVSLGYVLIQMVV